MGPHLTLRGNFEVFLELQHEALGFSAVATGTSGDLSCCLMEVKSPFKLQVGAEECCCGTAGKSGLISHCGGNLMVFFELQQEVCIPLRLPQEPQGTIHVACGESGRLSS